MIRFYMKYAFRNIRSNSLFSIINVVGLSLGIASCILIFEYLSNEWNYDTFHDNYESIYRIDQARQEDGALSESATTFSSVAPELAQTFPTIESTCRIHKITGNVIAQLDDQIFQEEKIMGADSSFFDLFSFSFKYGNAKGALQLPRSIVLTESIAEKYFGKANPIGQEIILDGAYGLWGQQGYQDRISYKVTGVLNDLPENSHIDFNFLISLNLYSN